MVDENMFYEILKSREDRALIQERLIHKYSLPIISFTLNIPGPKKDSLDYRNIHDVGMDIILDKLKKTQYNIVYMEKFHKVTGPEGYFSINIDPIELKCITVSIENEHPLGRLFDMDVFNGKRFQITRADIGLNPRKCLICEDNAKVCSRSRKHKLEELISEINKTYNQYKQNIF